MRDLAHPPKFQGTFSRTLITHTQWEAMAERFCINNRQIQYMYVSESVVVCVINQHSFACIQFDVKVPVPCLMTDVTAHTHTHTPPHNHICSLHIPIP